MSKDEIIQAVLGCANKLGRNPKMRELQAMSGVSGMVVWKRFGGIRKALEAAGLQASGPGFVETEAVLLLDWAGVVRKLKKLPSVNEYERAGRFSHKPFHNRYGSWRRMGEAFCRFAQENQLERKWRDVLTIIRSQAKKGEDGSRAEFRAGERPKGRRGALLWDRPVYGSPLQLAEMAHAPTNEMGVIFLFGALARQLGFIVHRIQGPFPDCIAMRRVGRDQCQRVRIEFEFESRNFLKHRHRHDRCDVIVCWAHNWAGCPEEIEVVELRKAVG